MAQITYVNKEYLYENGDIPAKNKVQDTDMNEIKNVVNSNETKELLAVTDTAPAQCSTGDKYFNTSTKKIYTATATNTWGTTGVNPTRNTIYLEFVTQTAYAYDGTTLVSVGGGSQGGGDSTPIGTVEAYSGSTAPNGYLLCDGSAVSRTTYSDLFSVIGTTYGSGDGSTTFNLPNLKGRTVVMQDTTQTEFDTLGETGGEKTHTLIVNEMPSHSHEYSYSYPDGYAYGDGSRYNVRNAERAANTLETGGGQAHNNLQPYIVLNYIIKANKISEVPTTAEVQNTYSTSQNDTYSCDYQNKAFGGTILWTNSNPDSSFTAQTIQLNLSQYDYIEIIYYTEVEAGSWQYEMTTGKLPIINGKNALLGGYVMITTANQAPQFFGRQAIIRTTGIEFATGKNYNGSSFSDRNASGVPLYIKGYKNN